MTPDDAVPRHPTNPRAELPSALVEARHDHVVLPAGDGVVGVRVEREGHVKRVGRPRRLLTPPRQTRRQHLREPVLARATRKISSIALRWYFRCYFT